MLSLLVFLPVAVGAVLALSARIPAGIARRILIATTVVEVALAGALTARSVGAGTDVLVAQERLEWIPGAGTSYHVGVDGLSVSLIVMTNVLFAVCAVWDARETDRPRPRAALFLFLQTTCLGVFAAQDLIVFFVFFDLSIVGMYFLIGGWGHGDRRRSALTFFLYTFLGSLALLLGFIGLYVGAEPNTFDMVELSRTGAFEGSAPLGGVALAAIVIGLAVKTPTVPFHSWLPPAHTDAPTTGSVILAGVMLKLGTYGFLRIAMPMLPGAWRSWAWVIVAVGIASVLWGALVALAQTDVKRMIAFSSVNHMGYVVLAVGAAGVLAEDGDTARTSALTGATVQMISHGLITGALFLLAGVLWDRRKTYDLNGFGGLAGPSPRFAALFAAAAFASLGLPAFSGFIAEFQIFAGAVALAPVSAVALLGIIVIAATMLRSFQRLFTGAPGAHSADFDDLNARETASVAVLMLLALIIGIVPAPLIDLVRPAMERLAGMFAG